MLGGVVRGVWNDCVRECRFPVYGNSPVCRGPMGGDVNEVILFVSPSTVNCIEVLQYSSGRLCGWCCR